MARPVDCELGSTYYIKQFMDHDFSDQYSDFQCGPRLYNTQKGTDFAAPTARAAKLGIDVIVRASAKVLVVRDGMKGV